MFFFSEHRHRNALKIGAVFAVVAGSDAIAQDLGSSSGAVACEALPSLAVAATTIASAETVASGEFRPEGARPRAAVAFLQLPTFCRVTGSIKPSADSDIRFEIWLPGDHWNGKFLQTGNGGAAGSISRSSMVDPLLRGYAVANTDTGHQGHFGDFSWAVGHPEKLIDFQHRAIHELSRVGKAIATTHYGDEPATAYWLDCSTGGRQGLKAAQLYPDDFDAVVAGAPASNWLRLMGLSVHIQNNLGPEALPIEKLDLLKESALAQCDANDGIIDRVISDPGSCSFDPVSLQCSSAENDQCLGPTAVAAAQRIYRGLVGSNGEVIIPGTGPGSEPAWASYASSDFAIGSNYFRNVIFEDPEWDRLSFDADTSIAQAESAGGGEIDAMDPDLSEFISRGGKLITYHGTTDGQIPFLNSVNYFESVVDTLGLEAVQESMRLYLVSGMNHCDGGEGASEIDWLTALEQWVDEGEAPNALHAVHPESDQDESAGESVGSAGFSRPVCPYPQVPQYRGRGAEMAASSFHCAASPTE